MNRKESDEKHDPGQRGKCDMSSNCNCFLLKKKKLTLHACLGDEEQKNTII